MEYIAHKSPDGRTQKVKDHLIDTSMLAEAFGKTFGGENEAKLAGLTHDLGKYSEDFQKRINGSQIQVDHSTFGGYVCYKMKHISAAFSVFGHHSGLPDGGSRTDKASKSTFRGRVNKAENNSIPTIVNSEWKEIIESQDFSNDGNHANQPEDFMFYTRMIFSCLVDADYLDTEKFMIGQSRTAYSNSDFPALKDKLEKYCQKWNNPETTLNEQRNLILQQAILKGENSKRGIFSLTVPTGGGKTISSLAFAINHCIENRLDRIIYVIPFTSIIEQTAETFRQILGDDVVLEHHSGYDFNVNNDDGVDNEKRYRLLLATENWNVPVVVTTAVQFFNSLFSNRPSTCRKLHNICNSIIIFDEAQMLPYSYLRPCVWSMSQLVEHYNSSIVLCTATQPVLQPIFEEFGYDKPIIEICTPGTIQKSTFDRVTFSKIESPLSVDEISSQLIKYNQVLCIVNSRISAQRIFNKIKEINEDKSIYHLSTFMCPFHRQRKLEEIRQRLKNNQSCRVISTSLIEAGVDVDFPIVYREKAGLDSIVQAAGRCNREGKRRCCDSQVVIFDQEEKSAPRSLETQIQIGTEIINDDSIAFWSDDAIRRYFDLLLHYKGKDAQDKKQIMNMMRDGDIPFKKIADLFQLIDQSSNLLFIPYNKRAKELISLLKGGTISKSELRELEQYCIEVPDGIFEEMNNNNMVMKLDDHHAEIIEDNIDLYNDDIGLNISRAIKDDGKAVFII